MQRARPSGGRARLFRPKLQSADDADIRRSQRHAGLDLGQGGCRRVRPIRAEIQGIVGSVEVEEARGRLELIVA